MSAQGSVRKRKDKEGSVIGKLKDASATGIAATRDADLDVLVKAKLENKSTGVEWDYRIAISVITFLAFISRFWGISHPNEVVFDEVHFGKVLSSAPVSEELKLILHPPVCLILSRANLLLRCTSSLRKATLRADGLVRWL